MNPDKMFADAGIHLLVERAEHVDAATKTVRLSDGRQIPYDKLVLGMGASPHLPSIDGTDLQGVFTLRSLRDAEKIRAFIEENKPRRLVFVGAGFISLELATLLSTSQPGGYESTVIELLGHPLPLMLDADMAVKVQQYLEDNGLNIKLGEKVMKISGANGCVSGVELASGESIPADMVFVNAGARPNLEIAEALGLEVGRFGIKVNHFLETSNADVLAAGDCVENHHFVTRRPAPIQLRGPAVIQGRLVAKRLAGYEIPFPGVLGNSLVKLLDLYIASTGLTEEQARQENFDTVCSTVDSSSRHGMIPGVKPWTIKLVFDKNSQKLIGGQIRQRQ